MKKIVYLIFCSAVFLSCNKKDDPIPTPVACFSVDTTETLDSTHVFLFDQCAPAYDAVYWDFGDGQYSSNPNPSHQFNHYGAYYVKLTVTNSSGGTGSVAHLIIIGHYSLSNVYLEQATSYFSYPYHISFAVSSVPNTPSPTQVFDVNAYSAAFFPFDYIHGYILDYDFIDDPMYLYYTEYNSSLQIDTVLPISHSEIIDRKKSFAIDFAPYDTVKFTLSFFVDPY